MIDYFWNSFRMFVNKSISVSCNVQSSVQLCSLQNCLQIASFHQACYAPEPRENLRSATIISALYRFSNHFRVTPWMDQTSDNSIILFLVATLKKGYMDRCKLHWRPFECPKMLYPQPLRRCLVIQLWQNICN